MGLPAEANSNTAVYDGLTVQLKPAPIGKRVLAAAVDYGIVGAAFYLAFIIMTFLGLGTYAVFHDLLKGLSGSSKTALAVAALIAALVLILASMIVNDGYFVYWEYKTGSTPGKKLFGLKVVSLDGARLSLGQCILRSVLRYLDSFLLFPGLLSMALTQKRQRLGDLAAGTAVTYSRQAEESATYMYVRQEDYLLLFDALRPAEIPVYIAKEFLEFSYRAYILRNQEFSAADVARYSALAHSYVPQARVQGYPEQTLLLFFAEYCFQCVNQSE